MRSAPAESVLEQGRRGGRDVEVVCACQSLCERDRDLDAKISESRRNKEKKGEGWLEEVVI